MNRSDNKTNQRNRYGIWVEAKMPQMYRIYALLRQSLHLVLGFHLRMAWLTLKAIFTGLRPIKTGSGTVFASIRKAIEYGNVGPIHLIDVGASDGWFTDGISREINIASVTCYEPLPDTWPTPTLGKATNKCVFRHLCVGNAVGKVIILQSNHSGLSSVLGFHNKYQYKFGGIDKIETIEKREVDMVTLDSDTHHHLSNKIVLKIDTQGYEMEVLKGAANLLSSGKVLIIVLELMLKLKYESQTNFEEIFPFLSSFGFEVYDIQKGYIEPSGGERIGYSLVSQQFI